MMWWFIPVRMNLYIFHAKFPFWNYRIFCSSILACDWNVFLLWHCPPPAGSSSCCSVGEPIVGNIINKVRCRNRNRHHRNDTNTNSSLLHTNSKYNSFNGDKHFQSPLPQIPVPLELGVIDTEPILKSDTHSQHDAHQLIEMCRRWRELSRKSRESNQHTD